MAVATFASCLPPHLFRNGRSVHGKHFRQPDSPAKLNFHKVYDSDRYVYAIWQPAERNFREFSAPSVKIYDLFETFSPLVFAKQRRNLQIEIK